MTEIDKINWLLPICILPKNPGIEPTIFNDPVAAINWDYYLVLSPVRLPQWVMLSEIAG